MDHPVGLFGIFNLFQLAVKSDPTSDSEMEEHLDAIRKAFPTKKKEGW